MSGSYQRFPSLLRQATRIGRQIHSSSLKRVCQADGACSGADEATPTDKTHERPASKRSRVRWGEFGKKEFKFSARPRTPTSKLHLHQHFATEAPHNTPNYAWNTTQLAPNVKYHEGASSHETSNGGDGMGGRPEYVIDHERRHHAILTIGGGPSLAVETEGSNGIGGNRLLNQGLQTLSFKPMHKAMRLNTTEKVLHNRPSIQSQSSPTTQDVQRNSPPLQPWQVQKRALLEKFGSSGWCPRKRLSPDVLEGIRALNSQSPEKYTTPVLAEQFKISPEAIRRILKSKWRPSEEEQAKRRLRWDSRGKAIWSQMVEIGIKPPKKWRAMGVKRRNEYYQWPISAPPVSFR